MDKIARVLLESGAVTISLEKPYRYSSGILSPIYSDNRLILSEPIHRDLVISSFIEKAKKLEFDCIAGVATAGIPWAAIIADRLQKPMVYVRNEAKGHGLQNQIEGKFKIGDKVLIIEDLISTGKSSLNAVDAIRAAKGKVFDMLAIFTYGFNEANLSFLNSKVNLQTLTNFISLIDQARKLGLKNEDIVLEWVKDPRGWEDKWNSTQKD